MITNNRRKTDSKRPWPSEQIEAVRLEDTAGTIERARTIGFLAGIALKAIEVGIVAARLESLEAVLKARNVA